MKYIIGFDGGGSKTRGVITDLEGNVIADKISGPTNYQTIGIYETEKTLKKLFLELIKEKEISKNQIAYVFLGLAGADMESDFAILNEVCHRIFESIPYEVVNDTWLIMRSGTKDPFGAVSIYGTGANAGAINKDGQMFILRALDYLLGGGGGGGEITQDALHYAFRSNELTYKKTALEIEVPKALDADNINSLLNKMYPIMQLSQTQLNRIPPLVFKLAKNGDLVSKEILRNHGRNQGEMLKGILLQGNFSKDEFPIILGGSVYKGESSEFMDAFQEVILQSYPKAKFKISELEPVTGAVLFAFDRLNYTINQNIIDNLKKSLSLK
ncbi:MAG: ATPase [Clostridia bacterium]|nr:ATPase [Clostridia bacterium]